MKIHLLHIIGLTFLLAYFNITNAQDQGVSTDTLFIEDSETEDTTNGLLISEIIIEGNNRTKKSIILRELSFKVNDRYSVNKLTRKFAESRRFLVNTGLFQNVVIALNSVEGKNAVVQVSVKERWYIIPGFDYKQMAGSKMDVQKVSYGIRLTHRNITGRNDKLHVSFMRGPTQQVGFKYEGLILDEQMKWSASVGLIFAKSYKINYATIDNKAITYQSNDEYAQQYIQPTLNVSYRPAIKTRHTFGLAYKFERIADTVSKLNWQYANGQRRIQYPDLSYTFNYADVDFIAYPLKGTLGEFSVLKRGLGSNFNLWQFTAKSSLTWPLSQKFFFNLRNAAVLKVPFSQPYIMQPLLGYNELTMQGYEGYVIDGVAGAYTKVIFMRELLNTAIHIPSQRIKRFNNIPIRLYGKVFGNTGFVYHPNSEKNILNNKMLYSGGFGLDIVGLTDFVLKLEWSFNQLEANGLSLFRRSYY